MHDEPITTSIVLILKRILKKYQPINCDLVDHIEHFATLKKEVAMAYLQNDGQSALINAVIVNWVNIGGEEFVVLNTSLKVRFDKILKIDQIDFVESKSCQVD